LPGESSKLRKKCSLSLKQVGKWLHLGKKNLSWRRGGDCVRDRNFMVVRGSDAIVKGKRLL